MDFGTRLKELRLKTGLTQKQLASQIGVTKSVISFYELRERAPSPEILIKLASVFHVTTDFLLCIEKEPEKPLLNLDGLTEKDIKLVLLLIETLRQKNTKIKPYKEDV